MTAQDARAVLTASPDLPGETPAEIIAAPDHAPAWPRRTPRVRTPSSESSRRATARRSVTGGIVLTPQRLRLASPG